MRVLLTYKQPMQWQSLKRILLAHAIPNLEIVDETAQTLRRLVRIGSEYVPINLSLKPTDDTIILDVETSSDTTAAQITEMTRSVLDLDSDMAKIGSILGQNAAMKPLVTAQPGLRLIGSFDPFETIIFTIIGQQISVAATRTFCGRLVRAFGDAHGDLYSFPTPERLALADPQEIYELTKINHKKVRTIQALSATVIAGLDLKSVKTSSDSEKVLLDVKGIGPWTVEYLKMRGLGDADAFLADDLLIKRALGVKTSAEAEKIAEQWRPLRAYAVMHIWTKAAFS